MQIYIKLMFKSTNLMLKFKKYMKNKNLFGKIYEDLSRNDVVVIRKKMILKNKSLHRNFTDRLQFIPIDKMKFELVVKLTTLFINNITEKNTKNTPIVFALVKYLKKSQEELTFKISTKNNETPIQ